MPFAIPNHRFRLSRFLVFVGLAISVFTWGLQYKLSLYDPPTAIAHQVPKAKLLSNDEHFRTAETIKAIVMKPVTRLTPQIFFLAILLLGPAVPEMRFLAGAIDALSMLKPSPASDLFVRPPPSLA